MFNGLFPSSLFTVHRGQLGGRGLSPRLWAHVNGQDLSPDGFSNFSLTGDDFQMFGTINPGTGGSTTTAQGGYATYMDVTTNAGSIKQAGNVGGGVITLASGTQDNYQSQMCAGGTTGVLGTINDASNPLLTIFECRFQVGQIANQYDAFIGLQDPGLMSAGGVITNSDALAAANNFVGFWINSSAGNTLQFVYQAANQTPVVAFANLATLVAGTWYKAGFVYNPREPVGRRLTVMVNNDNGQSIDNNVISGSVLQGTSFPGGQYLTFGACVKNNGANANTLLLDWWDFGQAGQSGEGLEGGP